MATNANRERTTTLTFGTDTTEVLKRLADKNQTTKTDVVRRAIKLYNFLEGGRSSADEPIQVSREDGVKVVLL